MAGKARSAQNSRSHGLYAKVLTGRDRARYEAAREYTPGEVLESNFYLIQGRVLGLLEGEGTFSRDAKTLLAACEVLVEQEEISPDFVEDLRLRLLNLDVERLARVFTSTASLAASALQHDKAGDAKAQLAVLKRLLVDVLQQSGDKVARTLCVKAIAELKLTAGLPSDELDALLTTINEESDDGDLESLAEPEVFDGSPTQRHSPMEAEEGQSDRELEGLG